ncbi:FkbM family methyltransferase [Bradyrhizobium arachidis]|uniref:FkbM family methyltransferase n=1 Tax=Bradyrhizobium arachidis TaxID=858423 RepID=UPI0008EB9AEC|nr:FkbM family methyltransferase [Bradyrhizobium arachidis]SFV00536.1 methyltransferase, FkbM family [Bradyrhizobium arachidis]
MNFEDVHFLVRCLRYRWRTEKLPLKTLMRLDLKGATVIDIGANKGIYSFWLARAVGPSGKVLAFEPQPEMIRYIQRRKQCFGLANVETIEAALSDSCGTAQLTRQRAAPPCAWRATDQAMRRSRSLSPFSTISRWQIRASSNAMSKAMSSASSPAQGG